MLFINNIYIRISVLLILILYVVIRIIRKNPVKIIKSKLDICICILVLSTIIPVICNTYVSFLSSIQTIIQYVYAFSFYVIIREIIQKKEKNQKIFINILIIVTIIIIIVGIDGITFNKISSMIEKIGISSTQNGENRISSIIGYPNTLAAYLASILFLNINQYLKQNKTTIKAMYKTISLLLIIGIILTYSKAVFVLLPVLLCIYILCIKDRNIKEEIIKNMLISTMVALVYTILFEKMLIKEEHLINWIALIAIITISYFVNLQIEKRQSLSKVLLRTKVIICSIAIGIGILYIIIGLNIYDKYEVFNEKVESNYEAKVINNIKGNEKYLLEFDIDSKAINDKEDMYTINLIERDEKNKIVNQTDIKFGTCSGIKQIELVTKETTKEIKIEFKSEYTYRSKKLIVNKLFINQQETPLKYKYLPTLLVEKIQSININYKTAKERIEMIKNALELAKESILTGIGGDGWQYKYEEVQNYSYISSKLHSYPAKIALEFGIIGIVSYIGLAIITLILCIKEVRKQNIAIISITFAFILLGLHSIIDLDMEYTAILIYALCLTGMLAKEYTNKNNSKIQYLSNIAFIIIMSISIYLTTNLNSYNKYVDISNELEKRNGLFIASEEYKMANYKIAQKYEELSYYERYNQLNNYKKIVEYYLESNSENKVEIIEKYVIKIANYEIRTKYNVNKIISKIETEYSIIKELEKQNDPQYNKIIEKMRDIILNECDSAKKKIEQCAKIQRKNYDLYLDELSHIYKSIN